MSQEEHLGGCKVGKGGQGVVCLEESISRFVFLAELYWISFYRISAIDASSSLETFLEGKTEVTERNSA